MSRGLSDTSVMYGGSNREREENEVLLLCVNFNRRDSVSICVSLTNSKRKITSKLCHKIFFAFVPCILQFSKLVIKTLKMSHKNLRLLIATCGLAIGRLTEHVVRLSGVEQGGSSCYPIKNVLGNK